MDITKKSVEYTKEHPDFKILEKRSKRRKSLSKRKESCTEQYKYVNRSYLRRTLKNVVEACIDKNVGIAKKRLLQNT